MSANVVDYGADPKGVAPSDAAFAAAFATGTKTVDAPAGIYRLDADLTPPAGVRVRGEGGAFRASATTLRLQGSATVRVTAASKACELSDLSIAGDRYGQRDALVLASAEFAMRGCYLLNSGKHGVRIDGASNVGNANGWSLDRVVIENCGEAAPGVYGADGFGVFVSGRDSQGSARSVRVVSSFGGISDRSFLGSTWTDCHAEGCTSRGYLSDTARSVWVGCYCELDSPTMMGSCIVLGGTLAVVARAQVAPPSGRSAPLIVDVGEVSRLLSRSNSGNVGVRSFFGFSDGRTPSAWQANEDAHEFGLTAHGTLAAKVWAIARARSLALASLLFTREGHALGSDQVIAPNGIHIGKGASLTHITAERLAQIEARLAALESP